MDNAGALIATGVVRHRRLRPAAHAFQVPTYFLLLPMRQPARRAQCGAGAQPLRTAVLPRPRPWRRPRRRAGLAGRAAGAEGIADADGEVWLHTYPRVLGYVFKPVSFWYCHRADGSLAAIVAEVNNTFGERHCYLLAGPDLAFGRELRARKVFHVSPFCDVQGSTASASCAPPTAPWPASTTTTRPARCCSPASAAGWQPLDRRSARAAFFGVPLMTLGVIARIHWHALRCGSSACPSSASRRRRRPSSPADLPPADPRRP
jgi:uncharacterized protein